MSAASVIESGEDLENVPLVRMEDVQPSRERNCEEEVLETCVVDNIEYDCVVNEDEDSNIGSMVSIQSEEVVGDDSDTAEMIVPEVLEPLDEIPIDIPEQKHTDLKPPESWPTLEILPGGVIKNADKCEDDLPYAEGPEKVEKGEMMYACAKCSESFKYLFCLVKHVKWHEDEKKKEKGLDMTKLTEYEKEFISIKRARQELDKEHKRKKVEVFGRIAEAMGKIESFDELFK
ncbi:uncharacterized protein LOC125237196 isoform X2 [Leguminivora glycinivorella]|uniref:uncharacterized protein LOC125237196 isoform X2 n=1 Tax=Leguminivora glycinivorella TaxID=1035111 RepID=UPI00200FA1A5|nr:uncharacterized protein LOC125237196 isoform X2 [Leguminivora glycinivorella]